LIFYVFWSFFFLCFVIVSLFIFFVLSFLFDGYLKTLQPGESVTYRLRFEVATSKARTRQILDAVTALQVATPRTVHAEPKTGWAS